MDVDDDDEYMNAAAAHAQPEIPIVGTWLDQLQYHSPSSYFL